MLTADIEITIGDNFWSPKWAVVIAGQAVDLATWTVRSQIRPYPGSPDVLHEFQGSGIQLGTVGVVLGDVETTTSTVQFYIPTMFTEQFSEWVGVWDWQIEHPTFGPGSTPYVRTLAGGKAETRWDVTR